MNFHPPRQGDLPRQELAKLADKTIKEHGGPSRCSVRFKFTCKWCGARCTLVEENTLYEKGGCADCGKETEILFGGFSLHFYLKDPNRN